MGPPARPLEVTIHALLHDPVVRSTLAVLAATAFAVACLPKEDDSRDDTYDSWGSTYTYYGYAQRQNTQRFGPEDITVNLDANGLTVRVLDAPGDMSFGYAQTGDCTTTTCWQGESCASDTAGPSVCHALTGETLKLTHVTAADHLVPSSTTLVTPDMRGTLTFLLDTGSECFTWGHSPAHYADAFGCTVW